MSQSLTVKKFGGSSLATPERILHVASLVSAAVASGERVVVVVSAMGDATDSLLGLARAVAAAPPKRELDMLLSSGERVSMALVCMALAERGVPAQSLTGSQVGVLTDAHHQSARIKTVLGNRVREALDAGQVVVVAGYQGVCADTKEITTLGRGGSDTSAVALAVGLGADRCEIYSDVPGVYTADPRLRGVTPRLWSELAYEHTLCLAKHGAQVLHARAVEIAKKFGLRLELRSSLDPGARGTKIMPKHDIQNIEGLKLTGVTLDRSRCFLDLELARSGVQGGLFLHASSVGLDLQGIVALDTRVSALVERDAVGEWDKMLRQWSQEGFIKSYELRTRLVPVTVVGDCVSQGAEAYAESLAILRAENIDPEIARVDDIALIFGVAEHRAEDAVRCLHQKLVEGL